MKERIKKHIKKALYYINKSTLSALNNLTPPLKSNYDDLTPTDRLEEDEYFKSLKWALKNDDIKNIALTGTYGSGKSSILKSFQKLNPQYDYINISLASFHIGDSERSGDEFNRQLERSILQQIFYKATPEELSDSRFKRIYSLSKSKLFLFSILFTLWLSSAISVFSPELIANSSLEKIYGYGLITSSYLSIPVFLFGFIFLTYKTIRLFKNLSFSKLNLAKGEIELEKEESSSIFNKHLDEILYFFESNSYDIVIIEDLDRFKNKDIFTKLRELNTLINQSKQVSRKIVFIYALTDEIFQDSKNRTKFFDFILPIIPVINSSNSQEKLKEKIKKAGWDKDISNKFISSVSIYIDDMRILKNIINEYAIYREKLSSVGLDQEKLLAIIIYKNHFPEDFSKLQKNNGLIPNVFQKRQTIIGKRSEELSSEIEALEDRIETVENEKLESVKELRKVYLAQIYMESRYGIQAFNLGGRQVSINQILDDKNFEMLQKQDKIEYKDGNNNRQFIQKSFHEIAKSAYGKLDYNERENLILNKEKNQLDKLKNKLNDLKQELERQSSLKMEELLKNISVEEEFEKEIHENRLLIFLLRNGYIDGMYPNYITYFYEGTLTSKDMDFIHSVKDKKSLDHDFSLTQIEEVIRWLDIGDFTKVEILNYDLINYLLNHAESNKKELDYIFELLSDESEDSLDFIEGFISDTERNIETFIKLLCESWDGIWNYIEFESKFTKEKKNTYLRHIINHASLENIDQINRASEGKLRAQIAKQNNFVQDYGDSGNIQKIKDVISKLDTKFKKLVHTQENIELLDFIYENDLYEINPHMLALFFHIKCGYEDYNEEKFLISNYTILESLECPKLKDYIRNNLETYVKNIHLGESQTEYIDEEETSILALINSTSIDVSFRSELLKKQKSKITDISSIQLKTIRKTAIRESKVEPSLENAVKFHDEIGLVDDNLIKFLNRKNNIDQILNEEITSTDLEKPAIKNFFKDTLECNELTSNAYEALVRISPFKFKSFNVSLIDKEKLKILIPNGTLEFNPENFTKLKSKNAKLHIDLIYSGLERFLGSIEEIDFQEEDLKELLSEERLMSKNKLKIINKIPTLEIKISDETLLLIKRILFDNAEAIINYNLLKMLLKKGLSLEEKVKLMTSQLEYLENEQILELLEILPENYRDLTRNGKRPTFKNIEANIDLLNKLEKIDIISSSKIISDEKIRAYSKFS